MKQPIQRVYSGAPWEAQVGYCRAIRVGDQIHISGTAPVDDQGNVVSSDGYAQTQQCLEIIQAALQELGTDCHAIVRTRMFVTDISRWQEFSKAHHEFFEAYPPTTTMVQVSALIDPVMLIEIEAEAVLLRDRPLLAAQDCGDMTDIRAAIDQIDEQIIAFLGQRFEYVKAAAQFKTDVQSVKAPERLQAMLQQRRQWAETAGLDADVIEKLYRDLVQYFIDLSLD